MKKICTSLLLLFFCLIFGTAQSTLIIQPGPETGKDAYLRFLDPDVNRGDHPDLSAQVGTNGGSVNFVRAIFDFDLSEIPSNATIVSAGLTLRSYDSASNSSHLGENAATIYVVTEPWEEDAVTWNNQPAKSETMFVTLDETKSDIQDFIGIDMTTLISAKISDPTNNHGFILELDNEEIYKTMLFASSDNEDASIRPQLTIRYTEAGSGVICERFQPGKDGKDAFLRFLDGDVNRGDHPDLLANAGTNGGVINFVRSIIDFDLSSVPVAIQIQYAGLSLYTYNADNGNHLSETGPNTAIINPVIEAWEEDMVTWNNQPAVDASGQIVLESATSITQNYLDIDVTPIVTNMVADPSVNQGFLFGLQTEEIYRRMTFASSDNEDGLIRPLLNVCYSEAIPTYESELSSLQYSLFPNPTSDVLTIKFETESLQELNAEIVDATGKLISKRNNIQTKEQFDVSEFAAGVYFISVHSFEKTLSKSFVVE